MRTGAGSSRARAVDCGYANGARRSGRLCRVRWRYGRGAFAQPILAAELCSGAQGLADRVFDRDVTEAGRSVVGLFPAPADDDDLPATLPRMPRVSKGAGFSVVQTRNPLAALFGRGSASTHRSQDASNMADAPKDGGRSGAGSLDEGKEATAPTLDERVAAMEETLAAIHNLLRGMKGDREGSTDN